MAAVVVFESIYGNSREVANAVAAGLGEATFVAAVGDIDEAVPSDSELLVVGGPTHMHGLATSMSRKMAVKGAEEDSDVELDPAARSERGVRDWLADLGGGGAAAAFDTRIDKSPALTGSAARGIAKRLRRRGFTVVADPESFFVDDAEAPWPQGSSSERGNWAPRFSISSASRAYTTRLSHRCDREISGT